MTALVVVLPFAHWHGLQLGLELPVELELELPVELFDYEQEYVNEESRSQHKLPFLLYTALSHVFQSQQTKSKRSTKTKSIPGHRVLNRTRRFDEVVQGQETDDLLRIAYNPQI